MISLNEFNAPRTRLGALTQALRHILRVGEIAA